MELRALDNESDAGGRVMRADSLNLISDGEQPQTEHGTLRVVMVLSEGLEGRGGIARLAGYLVRQLRTTAPEIDVRVMRSRFTERPILKHLSVMPAIVAFAARCLMDRVDIVHLNVAPRGSTWRKQLYATTAHWLRKPVILHLHGSGYDDFYLGLSSRQQARVRRLFSRAAMVVALSSHWRAVVAGFGVDEARIAEIPNGVPAATAKVAQDEAATNDAPSVLFLGVVGERKGVDVLLDALAELQRRDVPWRAVIAGNGELLTAVARARKLDIANRVSFPGWVDEAHVDTLLHAADIFVLPSRAENQPVSIIEAMARAKPVVATGIGAIPDQVIDGSTGILVKPGDVHGLANALEILLNAPELRTSYGQAGLRRFEEHYSVAACATRFAALYHRMGKRDTGVVNAG
jgi:glycosyltransferase involved in cell wall biosynthesis